MATVFKSRLREAIRPHLTAEPEVSVATVNYDTVKPSNVLSDCSGLDDILSSLHAIDLTDVHVRNVKSIKYISDVHILSGCLTEIIMFAWGINKVHDGMTLEIASKLASVVCSHIDGEFLDAFLASVQSDGKGISLIVKDPRRVLPIEALSWEEVESDMELPLDNLYDGKIFRLLWPKLTKEKKQIMLVNILRNGEFTCGMFDALINAFIEHATLEDLDEFVNECGNYIRDRGVYSRVVCSFMIRKLRPSIETTYLSGEEIKSFIRELPNYKRDLKNSALYTESIAYRNSILSNLLKGLYDLLPINPATDIIEEEKEEFVGRMETILEPCDR